MMMMMMMMMMINVRVFDLFDFAKEELIEMKQFNSI